VGIQPGGEVLEDRLRLTAAVRAALDLVDRGATAAAAETEGVDFKEEAGRRGRDGQILLGHPRNEAVAEKLADEVACLANTPGGGALIVGVADDGTRVGAASDRDWLRRRIHERADVAPAVEEHELRDGTRVLAILVAAAREPVEDMNGRIRWRVGASCAPVDRSQWWSDRLHRQGGDPLFATTTRTLADLAPGALVAVRRLLRGTIGGLPGGTMGGIDGLGDLSDRELVTRLGVLLPDGYLTAAGVHFFCPAPRTVLEFAVLDVPGGDVISPAPDLAGMSLVEQLVEIETRLHAADTAIVLRSGLRLDPVRQIPWPAVREALLNAVVHRDWLPMEPIHLTWVQGDSSLDVVSPGGFAGGVSSESVLSARFSRNPALADLARALGLVERQGVGVDRMYRELLALGHRPPLIREEHGPQVRTRLVGGQPLAVAMSVMGAIAPVVRRRDVRVALIVHVLLRDGFASVPSVAAMLQVPHGEAEEALDVAATCLVGELPLVRQGSAGLWLPGADVVRLATVDEPGVALARRRGLLAWWRPDATGARRLVSAWLDVHDRISSGDLAEVTSFTTTRARQLLDAMVKDGRLARGDASRGRNAHFVLARSAP
jgi:ATP-dependent DNA helicase RecG